MTAYMNICLILCCIGTLLLLLACLLLPIVSCFQKHYIDKCGHPYTIIPQALFFLLLGGMFCIGISTGWMLVRLIIKLIGN